VPSLADRHAPTRVSAARPTARRLVAAAALVVAMAALGACGGAATPAPTYPPGAVVVSAQNRTFDTDQLVLPADKEFPLVFVNKDGDQHNIAIRTKPGFDGDPIFRFDPVGARTIVLTAGPIPKGTYYFICEVHPTMTGTVVVQ
jgi:plastocyanin